MLGLRWRNRQSKRFSPLRSWAQFWLRFNSGYGLMHDTFVKRDSHRSTESRGFSPGSPTTGNVDRVGRDYPPN
jgi:hypothetical protein